MANKTNGNFIQDILNKEKEGGLQKSFNQAHLFKPSPLGSSTSNTTGTSQHTQPVAPSTDKK